MLILDHDSITIIELLCLAERLSDN